MFDTLGRFFLICATGLWLGLLVHLAFAVAPLNFAFSEEWSLSGVSPNTGETVQQRVVAGYLTAQTIKNTSKLQFWLFALATAGILLLWFPKQNRSILLLIKTSFVFTMGLFLWLSEIMVGKQMHDLLTSGVMETAITTGESIVKTRFSELHHLYSRLVLGIFISGFSLLITIAFRPFEHYGKNI